MRYLKLASAKNPTNDFIELNDFNGFLCTSFQTLGISRKLEFLEIKNRQFCVKNDTQFKKYALSIEILSKYSEYELKYNELITFLDRNKKDGFRLYYRPYDGMELRYCLCDIENSQKTEKMQPVILVFYQNSLWLGSEKISTTSQQGQTGNLFEFKQNEDVNDYYSANFILDEDISNYYCVTFYGGFETKASIVNNSYNEIPLKIKINGPCVNPTVSLYNKNDNKPIRQLQVIANIDNDHYIEINANIFDNGIWRVNSLTQEKTPYDELVNNKFGSPYFYIGNGEYVLDVTDYGNNNCVVDVYWQEEYN